MKQENRKIKKALISVSDKTGLEKLVRFLHEFKVEIISTGGTQKFIESLNIPVTAVESVTKNPEAFGGRMKSISFQIGSGLLYRRYHETDLKEASAMNIPEIDLVVCNLYPFEKYVGINANEDTLIENIDIGGPLMLRAAAKNYESVAVLSSPTDYETFIEKYNIHQNTNFLDRRTWAIQTFQRIASYDIAIADELNHRFGDDQKNFLDFNKQHTLRYGENPHQKATLAYVSNTNSQTKLTDAKFLQGKELSYNNWLDMDAAWRCMSDVYHSQSQSLKNKVTVVVKHSNSCGLVADQDSFSSLEKAWMGDSISSFGGIIACSYKIELEHAEFLTQRFIEVLIAPEFSAEALTIFEKKKNVRIMQSPIRDFTQNETMLRSISGGLLIQNEDELSLAQEKEELVTKRTFDLISSELKRFGVLACKFLKSNGIALVAENNGSYELLAAGMGQPNRLDSLRLLAHSRLKAKSISPKQIVLISDAFFPFADSVEVCAELGIEYIIQPGGSIKDKEVIECCDKNNIAMILTRVRHFRH